VVVEVLYGEGRLMATGAEDAGVVEHFPVMVILWVMLHLQIAATNATKNMIYVIVLLAEVNVFKPVISSLYNV